jgi:hypothetical protein
VAQNTAVHILDDLNGEPAEETVRFALDGVDYDIDLSAENAENLREALEIYLQHGRRTGGRKRAIRAIELPKGAKKATARSTATKKPVKAEAAPKRAAAKRAAPVTAAKTTTPKTTTKTKARVTRGAAAKPAVKTAAKAAAPKSGAKTPAVKAPAKKATATKKAAPTKTTTTTTTTAKTTGAKTARAPKPIRKAPAVTFSAIG